MSEYDIYLDGKGYMLAKDSKGRLVPGAAREQHIDAFTQQIARNEPYARVPFRFGDGAGLAVHDGSHRYEWGHGIDTRSGRALLAPDRSEIGEPYYQQVLAYNQSPTKEVLKSGTQEGIGERFQTPSGYTTVRSVIVMLKRSDSMDYSSAGSFYVAIHEDDSGPKPKEPALDFVACSMKKESDQFMPFPDRWRNADWFWLEVTFDSDVVIGASTPFWISVSYTGTEELHWGATSSAQSATRSVKSGSTWTNGASDYPMMIKLGYKDGTNQFDSFVRCFQVYRGSDNIERMYAGTNYRVLYFDPTWTGGHWWESKTIGSRVTQLLEFSNKLFAACGPTTDFWYSDGSAPGSTAWTQVSGQQSNAFAVHDNMLWKADDHNVNGSEDGTTWTGSAVAVGDPGTPVQSMVSHGGKLYAAKAEGIYEINYPDTYPGSGDPSANLMLDFNTERSPRMWLLDWHSGLYFPGPGGVYELKNGILRNLWEDKVDENAMDPTFGASWGWGGDVLPGSGGGPAPAIGGTYVRPRSWAPLYDTGPVAWTSAHGTTRGILFARTNPHIQTSDLIWYDGRNWYSIRAAGDTLNTTGAPKDLAEYILACFVQDAGGGRGWMWFGDGAGISRTEWPTWTDDTSDDATTDYEETGMFTTPWFTMPQQSHEMALIKVGLNSVNLDSTHTILIHYRTELNASWTLLGTFQTSPYQEVNFPSGTTARRVQFKLFYDNYTGGLSYTLIAEQLDLFYQTLPEISRTHQLMIACTGDQALREGGIDERSASEVLADLRALMGQANFNYVDLLGTSHTVRATALTAQPLNLLTGPGLEGIGREVQIILNLLEIQDWSS